MRRVIAVGAGTAIVAASLFVVAPAQAGAPYEVTARLSEPATATGSVVKLRGTVSPKARGRVVLLQRYSGGRWTTIRSKVLTASSTYSFRISPSKAGTFRYRAVKPAGSGHARDASPARTLRVARCANAPLFRAAARAENIDPNGPGYGYPYPGAYVEILPVATGAKCSGRWATALVSRPNVGQTDGDTLFKVNDRGRWVEIDQLEGCKSAARLRSFGMPERDIKVLSSEGGFC